MRITPEQAQLRLRMVPGLRKLQMYGVRTEMRIVGICTNVHDYVDATGLDYLGNPTKECMAIFVELGLDDTYPIGGSDEWCLPDLWEGYRGECRKLLACCMADQIETGRAPRLEELKTMLRLLARQDGRDWP